MRKKILVFVSIYFCSLLSAQRYQDLMQDTSANFYDIVKAFDAYWKDKPYEKGRGYKVFKRWQYEMEPHVYPSGNISAYLKIKAAVTKELLENFNTESQQQYRSNSSVVANWQPMGPFGNSNSLGYAGRIQCIAMSPLGTNTFYVGTAAGGLWITNNGGNSYTTTTNTLPVHGIADIAIPTLSPNVIYIATGDKDAFHSESVGVMKSTNGGQTWSTTGFSYTPQYLRIKRLIVNPLNPNSLLLASVQGIFKTINGGISWTQTAFGSFYDVEYNPSDTTVIHAVSNDTYYKSTDGGLTFTAGLNTGNSSRLALSVSGANSNYVYILRSEGSADAFGGLWRSTNNGVSFTQMSSSPNIFHWSSNGIGTGGQGWYDIALAVSPTNPNELIAGGVNTWKSLDGGATWVLNTIWYTGGGVPFVHADVHYIDYLNSTTVMMGTDGGIEKTTNSGVTWLTLNGNMNIAQVYKIGCSANLSDKLVAGMQDNGTTLLSGNTWSGLTEGDGTTCFIDYSNNNTLVTSAQYGNFYLTTNNGASFTSITSGLSGSADWVAPIVQSPTNATTYFCGYQNIFKSTNQGNSWTQISNLNTGKLWNIKISPSNPAIMYVNSSTSLFKTTDGGLTWVNITGTIPISVTVISGIEVDNQNPNNVYITLAGTSATNKVYYSTNGGTTWMNYSTGLPNISIKCVEFQKNSSGLVYIGTDAGVYYRTSAMSSWATYNIGFPTIVNIQDLEIFYPTNKLRAATFSRGVWESDLVIPASVAAPSASFSPAVNSSVCVNSSVQFVDNSLYSPTTWNWTFSGGSISTSTLQNPNNSFSTTGVYTVNLQVSNLLGTNSYSTTINVINTPTYSTSNYTMCVGQTTLVNLITNGTNIIWNTGQTSSNITATNTTNMLYTFTTAIGQCQNSGSLTVFTIPQPISPTIFVASTGLLTTTTSAVSYQWYVNGTPISGYTSQSCAPLFNGFYTVKINNGFCDINSAAFQLTNLDLDANTFKDEVSLFPNPAKNELYLKFSSNFSGKVVECIIYDEVGKSILITTATLKDKEIKLDIGELKVGQYFIVIKTKSMLIVKKFVKA